MSGTSSFRVFEIANGSFTVNISGLTISNGHGADGVSGSDGASGGGILNNPSATLNLDSVIVSGNQSGAAGSGGGFYGGFGGGISNLGTLTLTNSTVTNNQAGSGTSAGNTGGFGGGISNGGRSSNPGTLTITNSTISNNTSGASVCTEVPAAASRIILYQTSTFCSSTISNNVAGAGCDLSCAGGRAAAYTTLRVRVC